MNAKRKQIVRRIVILAAIYLLGFIPLWLGGGYVLTESGKVRQFLGIATGIAAPDIADWQPLFGHCQPEYHWPTDEVSPRCNALGWAYYPLWILVRKGHPSVQLLTEDGKIVKKPSLPAGFRFHPLRGRELQGIIQATPDAPKS